MRPPLVVVEQGQGPTSAHVAEAPATELDSEEELAEMSLGSGECAVEYFEGARDVLGAVEQVRA
jgi:hypothetical protein